MNNKKVIAGVILLLVLIILGAGYFFFSPKKTASPTTENNPVASAPKSLNELLGLGTSQKCTFSSVNGSDTTSGTVYVAGGKMRGDFTSNVSGQSTSSHMIVDGTTSYTWMDGQSTGYKMTFNPETGATPSATGSQTSQGPDLNQKSDYNCSAWTADSSLFTLPADVKFMSLGDLLPTPPSAAGTGTGTSVSSQCSYCDSLTGDSKTQCKSALNCP